MTIKQLGGVFGRNPEFNEVDVKKISIESSVQPSLEINNTGSDGDILSIEKNGSAVGSLGNFSTRLYIESDGDASGLLFGATDVSPRKNGINISDSVSLGNSTNKFKYLYLTRNVVVDNGYGIDFSATAGTGTSELLDDYEEGTWDCVIKDAYTGNVGSTHTGNYTKIGKVVVITVVCSNITTVGLTAGNDIYFTGLPFSPVAVSSGSVSANDITFAGYLSAQNAGAPYFRLSETASGATKDNVLVSQITSGSSDVWVQLTYEV